MGIGSRLFLIIFISLGLGIFVSYIIAERDITDTFQKHIINVLGLSCIDINKIREKKFSVVVDAVNGAGYDALPKLLEALNCNVITINCNPSGDFVRGAEPLPKNLNMLSITPAN